MGFINIAVVLFLLLVLCIGIVWIFELEKLLPLVTGLYTLICLFSCVSVICLSVI